MKKILLLLALLPCMVVASQQSVSGNASGWTVSADDTLILNGNAVIDNVTITCKALWIPTGSNYTLGESGASGLIVSGNVIFYKDSSTGDKTLPKKISVTGNGRMVISSAVGTITAAACTLSVSGTKDTLLQFKASIVWGRIIVNGTTFLQIGLGAGGNPSITNSVPPIVFTGAGTIYNTRTIGVNLQSSGYFIDAQSGVPTLDGDGSPIYLTQSSLSDTKDSIPALNLKTSLLVRSGQIAARTNSFYNMGNIVGSTASCNYWTYSSGANTVNFYMNGYKLLNVKYGPGGSAGITNHYLGSANHSFQSYDGSLNSGGTVNIYFPLGTIDTCFGNWTNGATNNKYDSATIIFAGTAAQTITPNGISFNDLIVANTGTATVKVVGSLRCNGDLTLADGRDSLPDSVLCDDYDNHTNDSVLMGPLSITGDYYRNNDKIKRLSGNLLFYGIDNGTINLVDAGRLGPIVLNRPGKTITALSALRCWRLLDSAAGFRMGIYALACTTLTVRDTGLQCAAVVLDTLHSYKGGVLGGGTIVRWNWLADALKYAMASGTTLTVGSINGIGGTAGALDSLTGAAAWNLALTGTQSLTLSYLYVKNCQLSAGDSLILTDGTSIDGGGNSGNIVFASGATTTRRHRGWLGLGLWIRP